MTIHPLGKILVTTPGTAVPLTTDFSIRASKIVVAQIPGGTGTVWFGTLGVVGSTGTNVIKPFLAAPATGFIDDHKLEDSENGRGNLRPADYAVDAATATNGLYAYYVEE